MKISLITVSRNSCTTIEDTIKSVANQTYHNVEYVVVDGLSTDSTLDILKRYSGVVTKIISEQDTGIYDAMNKGVAQVTGDIVGFINSDDILADDLVLQRVSDEFSDNPEIDACYADLCYVKRDDLTKVVRYWRSNSYHDGLFKRGWVPPHPTFFVRREIYNKYGGFDLSYRIAADFELILRFIAKYGLKSAHIPRVLVKMRMGGTTNRSVRNIVSQNLEIRRALREHGIASSFAVFAAYKLFTRFMQFIRRPE